ncbi:unnamed protein product [Caenorhabditis brenneri]
MKSLLVILFIFSVISEISTKDYGPVEVYFEDYYVGVRHIDYGVDLEKPTIIFMYNDYKFDEEEEEPKEPIKMSKRVVGTVIYYERKTDKTTIK